MKVNKWVTDVKNLSELAKEEPQAALSAFNVGMSQRWSFVQRTVKGIASLFQPLEDAICDHLIPALIGKRVSEVQRRLLALPYRYGGLGIRNPVSTADFEYPASVKITQPLTNLIYNQDCNLSNLDEDLVKEIKAEVHLEKEKMFQEEEKEILSHLDEKAQG